MINKKKNYKRVYLFLVFLIFNSNIVFSKEIYELEAENVEYQNQKKLVIAKGKAIAKYKNKKIFSDKIFYYQDKNIIETFGNSKFQDGKNVLEANKFIFYIDINKIEAKQNVSLKDSENNKYFFDSFEFYQDKQFGSGEKIKSALNDGSNLEAISGNINKSTGISTLNNAKYTTCSTVYNKDKEYCPTWSLKSKKIIHDKNKKRIVHKNALLRIKNVPILYTPYLSHPDPSVIKQSGFLPPLIKTIANVGRTFRIPYYWALAEDKDLTLTPVYYFDEKNAILASYRQALRNGYLQIENGYSGGYKRIEGQSKRTSGSRNYLFLKYEGRKKNLIFNDNKINFKLERVSQRNFLRINKINTDLFNEDIKTLENSFEINSYGENKQLKIKTGIFENLDVDSFDKYTFLVPDVYYNYNFGNFKNFNFNLNTDLQGKINQSQKEVKLRNFLSLNSRNFISKKHGFETRLKTNFFNKSLYIDTLNDTSNESTKNYFTIALENSLPLSKIDKKVFQTLSPNVFLKYTTGTMNNATAKQNVFKYADIFSMNRTNDVEIPEVGLSLGHGIDYSLDKKMNNESKLNTTLGIGQVLRSSKLDKMPTTTTLNKKSSDFAGFINVKYFDNLKKINKISNNKNYTSSLIGENSFSFNYDFNLSNDFKRFNRNDIGMNWNYNNLSSNIKYIEKRDYIGNEKTVFTDIKKIFKDNYYIRYEGKKNLVNNRSEFHNLSFNYENDCIITSLTFAKNFYQDQDLTSKKNFIFSIIFKPFGDGVSPDLSSFIK